MVLLGGLEVLAVGYVIHQHEKNKRERQRAIEEEEAAALEEEEYRRHRRNHSHERKRPHSRRRHHNRRHSYDGKDTYDGRPQYMNPSASQPALQRPIIQQQQQQQQRPPQPGSEIYPPTGWPAHWDQSQTPPPPAPTNYQQPPPSYSATPAPVGGPGNVQYGWVPDEKVQPGQQRGRTGMSGGGSRHNSDPSPPTPHVRFALPSDTPQPGERWNTPPPQYRS